MKTMKEKFAIYYYFSISFTGLFLGNKIEMLFSEPLIKNENHMIIMSIIVAIGLYIFDFSKNKK
ncbi:putative membrane protein [Oxalobacteraceae bacterium GrIS 1.11]